MNYPTKLAKNIICKTINLSPTKRLTNSLIKKRQYCSLYKSIKDSKKVYWIPQETIRYASNFQTKLNKKIDILNNGEKEKKPDKNIDSNWDKKTVKFTNLEIYNTIKKTIEKDKELHKTNFFKSLLRKAKSQNKFWSSSNTINIQKLYEYFNQLQIFPKFKPNNLRSHFHLRKNYEEAIDVNIGRNGEYLFQNNVYLLSIAKLFKIKMIPVRVIRRHKQWQKLKEYVFIYVHPNTNMFLYQPIVHPDFAEFPLQPHNKCLETIQTIKSHLPKNSGKMLDIGANLGFFCHQFENLGYHCYAVENDINKYRILERIKIAENKKFVTLNKSIFEVDFLKTMKFDVVLALNIFHHFLKTKKLFFQLKELLTNLETEMMFLSTANYREEQMRNAYQNYSQPRFVEFILQQTTLTKSQTILTGRSNRNIYKLTK